MHDVPLAGSPERIADDGLGFLRGLRFLRLGGLLGGLGHGRLDDSLNGFLGGLGHGGLDDSLNGFLGGLGHGRLDDSLNGFLGGLDGGRRILDRLGGGLLGCVGLVGGVDLVGGVNLVVDVGLTEDDRRRFIGAAVFVREVGLAGFDRSVLLEVGLAVVGQPLVLLGGERLRSIGVGIVHGVRGLRIGRGISS